MTGSSDQLPPWERLGAVRRDCEPHRGELLLYLSAVGLGIGLASLCCPPLGVFGLVYVGVVRFVAGHDLRQMNAGALDPNGREATLYAQHRAERATEWMVAAWVLWLTGMAGCAVAGLLLGGR